MPTLTPTTIRVHGYMLARAVEGKWSGRMPDIQAALNISDSAVTHSIMALREARIIGLFTRGQRGDTPSVYVVGEIPEPIPDAIVPAVPGEWTSGTIARLRALWAEGLSTPEIGRRIGFSKNAVVGKAHRLHLPARPSPIRRDPDAAPRAPRVTGPTLPPLRSLMEPIPDVVVAHSWSAPVHVPRPVIVEPVAVAAPAIAAPVHAPAPVPAAPRPWTPPKPRPVRAPVVPPTAPVRADKATIRWWAAQRGLDGEDLDIVNAKRAYLGMAPFAVETRF